VTNVGATSNSSFTYYNLGTGPITIAAPALGGTNPGDFNVYQSNCPVGPATLASGGSCVVYVSFTPTAPGVRAATVTMTDNSAQNPHMVQLTGTAQATTESIAFNVGTVTFGAVTMGASTNNSFTVYNVGTGPVTATSYALGGTNPGDFNIYNSNCPASPSTLNAGGNCTVYVSFTPAAAGVRSATISITDNATGSPQVVNLVGAGQTAVQSLGFSVVNSDFGIEPVGYTSSTNSVQATNNGDASISLTSVTITGANATDFSITSNGCSASIAATSNCYVYVIPIPPRAVRKALLSPASAKA
jgi:hypothetical protein